MRLEDDLLQFRLSLVRYFKTNIRVKKVWPRGVANLRKNIKKELKQVQANGTYSTFYENGKLLGYVSLKSGGSMTALAKDSSLKNLRLWVDPYSKTAMKWAACEIQSLGRQWGDRFDCTVDYWCEPLLKEFERHGVYLSCVIIDGNVKQSLKRLERKYPSLRIQRENLDFQIRPMKSASDVEAAIKIIKKEFSRNPQFGWFVTHPSFLNEIRKEMKAGMKKKYTHDWVIVKKGKVLGQFGYTPTKAFDGKTKTASFGLNFSQAAQNQGLAKHAYQLMLTELAKQKYVYYCGGTAQPGVMKLAKIMGRQCYALELVAAKKRPFSRDYFKDWLQF